MSTKRKRKKRKDLGLKLDSVWEETDCERRGLACPVTWLVVPSPFLNPKITLRSAY